MRFGPRRYNAAALRPAPHLLRRAAVVGLLLSLLAPASALANYIAPEDGGSPNANKINTLYVITLVIAIIIFLLVEGVLIYSLIKFRRRRRDEEPAQIRGNTTLELGWTLGAAAILVVLTVVTFIYLPGIKNPSASEPGGLASADAQVQYASLNQPAPPGKRPYLTIGVNGQQYIWRYDYPGTPGSLFSYYDMYVPIKTTVVLNITSSDVIHSWWVPQLGGKADAVPRHTNHTWFRIDKPGIYTGRCAELCGDNHADMRNRVIAVTPEQYQAWAARQRAGITQSQALLALSRKVRGQQGF
jgi:cytochrome c oxidase subunit II